MEPDRTKRLQFQTVRVGVLVVDVGDEKIDMDVRILLGSDGAYRLLLGELSEPLESMEDAIRRAEAPQPMSPDVTCEVRWRLDATIAGSDERPCPVCRAPTTFMPRYPRRLCPACILEATDARGRLLRFANTSFGGGFAACFADDGSPYPSHECFVRGVRCRAGEHRFGGIVVEPWTERP